jgi:hypothetical protein
MAESGFEDAIAAQRAASRLKSAPHPGVIYLYGEVIVIDSDAEKFDQLLVNAALAGAILLKADRTELGWSMSMIVVGDMGFFLSNLKASSPDAVVQRQKRETRGERKVRLASLDQ